MPEKAKFQIPDFDALERGNPIDPTNARPAELPPEAVNAGGASAPASWAERQNAAGTGGGQLADTMNDASLAFLDKLSLGGLPWLRDKIEQATGQTTGGKGIREMQAEGENRSPIASTVGSAAGVLPWMMAGGAGAARAGITAPWAAGAVGAGGANAADQLTRAGLEDRPFNPVELGLNTAAGALGPAIVPAITHPIHTAAAYATKRFMPSILEGALAGTKQAVPDAAEAAIKTMAESGMPIRPSKMGGLPGFAEHLNESIRAGKNWRTGEAPVRSAAAPKPTPEPLPEPPPAPGPLRPPGEDLSAYALDDPLAQFARIAREQGRPGAPMPPPRQPDLSQPDMPNFTPRPPPIPQRPAIPFQPVPDPPTSGLLDLPYIRYGTAAGGEAALDTAAREKKQGLKRKKRAR